MERLVEINDVDLDTRLQLLRWRERFHLVSTCRCGHSGTYELETIKDWRFCARWMIDKGRCKACGARGQLAHLVLEHIGRKHQPIETRLLWAGEPVQRKATIRGTEAQIEAAKRYGAETVRRDSVRL